MHDIGETYSVTMSDGHRYTMRISHPAENKDIPVDDIQRRPLPLKLVSHDIADKFIITAYNLPWIKTPVCYIEDDTLYIVYDSINNPLPTDAEIVYIKIPNKFAKDLTKISATGISYFDDNNQNLPEYEFECNDTMAEELISLAIAFALENVESQRLNSKLNMRGLEA